MRCKLTFWFIISLGSYVLGQQEGDIRFNGIGCFANQGRIEVYHANEWGTVCDDAFEEVDAKVLCIQLGYDLGGIVMNSSVFGLGTGQIWMDDVTCSGTERRLIDCQFSNWGNSDCTHNEDVGVRCNTVTINPTPANAITTTQPQIIIQPSNCAVPNTKVRIVGHLPGSGVVEVSRNNQWGTICDDSWGIYNARVICRMYCYNSSEAQAGSPTASAELLNILNPIRLDDVQCLGSETSIFDCPARPWNQHNCGPTEWAKVSCLRLDHSPPAAPLPLLQCTNGRFTASFSRIRDPYLEPKHLSVGMVYDGTCATDKTSDADYVFFIIPFHQCGTLATTNVSHIFYENVIRYNATYIEKNIVRGNTYRIVVLCEFLKYFLNVSNQQALIPVTETVTKRAPGQLAVNLIFYQNNSFTNPVTQYPLQLTLGEYIYAMLILSDTAYDIRLVVSNCIATPSMNKSDPTQYPLFQNKCDKDPTVTFFPLNNTMFGFWYKTFRFVNFDTVYIHCDGLLCLVSETSAKCDRSCNATDRTGSRRRRSRDAVETSFQVSSAPVYIFSRQDNVNNQKENDVTRLAPPTTTKQQSIMSSPSPPNTSGQHSSTESPVASSHTSAKLNTTLKTPAVLFTNLLSLTYSQPPVPQEANIKHVSKSGSTKKSIVLSKSNDVGPASGPKSNVRLTSETEPVNMLGSTEPLVVSAKGDIEPVNGPNLTFPLTFEKEVSNLPDQASCVSFIVGGTGNRDTYSLPLLVTLATVSLIMHVLWKIYFI